VRLGTLKDGSIVPCGAYPLNLDQVAGLKWLRRHRYKNRARSVGREKSRVPRIDLQIVVCNYGGQTYGVVPHSLCERQIVDVAGFSERRQRLWPGLRLLTSRSPPLKQAENNSQDKIAVAAQGPGPLLPIGIFLRRRKRFGPAISRATAAQPDLGGSTRTPLPIKYSARRKLRHFDRCFGRFRDN
jgi:hypothetical protein